MKLLFLGDTHGNIPNMMKAYKYAIDNSCDAIIQVGDFGYGFPEHDKFEHQHKQISRPIPFYFIKGNHDNPEALAQYKEITELYHNFFFIPNGVKFEIDNVSFVAYGGAFSIDKMYRTERIDYWRDEEISLTEVAESKNIGSVDVIISHDAPLNSNLDDYMDLIPITEALGNRHKLQAIVENIKPKLLIHGHYHNKQICSCNYSDGDIVTYFPSIALGFDKSSIADQCYILDTEEFKKSKI